MWGGDELARAPLARGLALAGLSASGLAASSRRLNRDPREVVPISADRWRRCWPRSTRVRVATGGRADGMLLAEIEAGGYAHRPRHAGAVSTDVLALAPPLVRPARLPASALEFAVACVHAGWG